MERDVECVAQGVGRDPGLPGAKERESVAAREGKGDRLPIEGGTHAGREREGDDAENRVALDRDPAGLAEEVGCHGRGGG